MPALGRLFALEDCLYALGGQGCKTYIYIEVLPTGSPKQLSGCLNNHMFCLLAQCVHSYVATRREGENLLASGHVYIADSGSAKNCSARSLSWLGCPWRMGKGSQLLGARQNLVWDSDGPNSIEFEDQSSAMVYIHTLAQYTAEGSGRHAMSSLKRMTGTDSFKELPDSQKNCQVHNREQCQTRKFLEHVQNNCNCVPWAATLDHSTEKVHIITLHFI